MFPQCSAHKLWFVFHQYLTLIFGQQLSPLKQILLYLSLAVLIFVNLAASNVTLVLNCQYQCHVRCF